MAKKKQYEQTDFEENPPPTGKHRAHYTDSPPTMSHPDNKALLRTVSVTASAMKSVNGQELDTVNEMLSMLGFYAQYLKMTIPLESKKSKREMRTVEGFPILFVRKKIPSRDGRSRSSGTIRGYIAFIPHKTRTHSELHGAEIRGTWHRVPREKGKVKIRYRWDASEPKVISPTELLEHTTYAELRSYAEAECDRRMRELITRRQSFENVLPTILGAGKTLQARLITITQKIPRAKKS